MPTQQDIRYAQAAIKAGFLDKSKAQELLQAQKVAEDASGTQIAFHQVAVNKKALTPDQIRGIEAALGIGAQPKVKQFGPYLVQKKIGEGGMGAVYLATDTRAGSPVALKVLSSALAKDSQYLQRFQREASMASALEHPNVVRCYGTGLEQNIHYMALEYVDGGDAMDLLEQGPVPEAEALEIAIQVADALGAAHERGIIHRDIKPHNILMTKDGMAKLADLGLARAEEDHSVTQTGIAIGTPHYMSPEQAQGEKGIDIRADLYALGATLYHMVCGKPPFSGATAVAVLAQHLDKQIPSPKQAVPELSDGVCHVIAKCMAKAPRDRYQAPGELLEDIRLVQRGEAPASEALAAGLSTVQQEAIRRAAATVRDRRRAAAKKSPAPIMVGAVAILTVALAIGFFTLRPKPGKSESSPQTGPKGATTSPAEPSGKQGPAETELSRLKAAYEDALAYAKANPEEYEKAIQQLSEVGSAAEGTKWAALAKGEAERTEATRRGAAEAALAALRQDIEQLAREGRFGDALRAATAFPENLRPGLSEGQLDELKNSVAESARQRLEALTAEAGKLVESGKFAEARKLYEQAKALGVEDLAAVAARKLEELSELERAAEESRKQALAAAFEKFWRQYETHIKKKEFDESVALCKGGSPEGGITDLRAMLGHDAKLLQTLFADFARNLPQLKGKTIRIKGMTMTVSDVRDGKVFVKQGGAEMGWDPGNLDHDTILLVALASVDDPKSKARRKALYAFHYGKSSDAVKALKDAAQAGEDVSFYQSRMVPVLVVTTTPSGATVELARMVDGEWEMAGEKARTTPLRLEVERNTTYRLRTTRDGYLSVTKEVKIGEAGEFRVSERLKKAHLPAPLARHFEIPGKPNDRHGNPIRRGSDKVTGLPLEIRHRATGMHFVFIPAGEFVMGSPEGEKGRHVNEGPTHRVRLTRPFYMGKYEITVRVFKIFVRDTGYQTESERNFPRENCHWDGQTWVNKPGATWRAPKFDQDDRHPAVLISWNDSRELAKWLNKGLSLRMGEGRGGRSGGNVGAEGSWRFVLPTEAQWEYACRAGTTARFYWGDDETQAGRSGNVHDRTMADRMPKWKVGWSLPRFETQDGYAFTAPVGKYTPNGWGLYDMIGNVWEWCRDGYGGYPAGETTDPSGLGTSATRVGRGGCWGHGPREARSAYRWHTTPTNRYATAGARLCVEIPDLPSSGSEAPRKVVSSLRGAFDIPKGSKDKHDNSIRKWQDKKTGLPLEIRHKKTGMHLVFIPAGEFMMGSPKGQANERPAHTVRFTRPFYIGKYEVTVGEFARFVKEASYRTIPERGKGGRTIRSGRWEDVPDATWRKPYFEQDATHPVVLVTWTDWNAMIKWLNDGLRRAAPSRALEGRSKAGHVPQFALPTEPQREYACRAGTNTRFFWGDDVTLATKFDNVCDRAFTLKYPNWSPLTKDESDGYVHTAPVGRFRPNAFGLYDLHGNVGEFCQRSYAAYPTGEVVDPPGLEGSANSVVRGGYWGSPPQYLGAAWRGKWDANHGISSLGSRLVLNLPSP